MNLLNLYGTNTRTVGSLKPCSVYIKFGGKEGGREGIRDRISLENGVVGEEG